MQTGVYSAQKKDGTVYYRANITYQTKHISLGSFSSEEDAHSAYLEACNLLENEAVTLFNIHSQIRHLSFDKAVCLLNFRDNHLYFHNPIYLRKGYFSYFLSDDMELKFDIDDLFYYAGHRIQKRQGHLFVSDYGMQYSILSRYGIKPYAVTGRDYLFFNGDTHDFRYSNIEIIILNDGSKDQSLPVCEAFRAKDERIVLVDKANSGVSDTRNLGLKLASGKYVQFVDSDDYIDPDFTEHLVTAAEQNNADLVIAPYKMVIPAGATKPEQVLEKLEDNLGVMSVARPPEVREYGFLPAGVYDKDTFALRLMDKPASYFYSVLWNKLYRRILLTGNDIQFTSELKWAEDLVFNMQYIQYAETFVSIDKAGYYYVQNPQSICHTQINPASIVQNKIQTFRYYKDLYTRLGMYEEVRPQLYKFLVDIAESTYPSGPFKKIIEEAKEYWKNRKE